jgi:hypothetical protein
LTSDDTSVTTEVSSEGEERKEWTMTRMLIWWGLAAAVGTFLLPASLESLSAALGGLAAELGAQVVPSSDVPTLVPLLVAI